MQSAPAATVARFQDWPFRLESFITERRDRPFKWGEQDCALFCADAVLAMTGYDFAEPYRGQYDTAKGAVSLAGEIEDRNDPFGLVRILEATGLPEIRPSFAQRGDVLLIDSDKECSRVGRQHLGVCIGAVAAAAGKAGLVMVPRRFWRRAWRV